jgi:predicted SprT family Zn-dependent metalloprotease
MLQFTRDKQIHGGHYCPDVWTDDDGHKVGEICINSNTFTENTPEQIMNIINTVAHEMVHHWQHVFGEPTRNGYHNQAWANKAKEIGLQPFGPDGKELGQAIDTKIIEGGPLDLALNDLPESAVMPFFTLNIGGNDPDVVVVQVPAETPAPKSGTRKRYSCPKCGLKVWGKQGLRLLCQDCNEALIESHKKETED